MRLQAPAAAKLGAHHGHSAAALAAEGILKLNAMRTRIPVRAAGLTIGSFRHRHDRTAAVVPADDGTVAGGAPPATYSSRAARSIDVRVLSVLAQIVHPVQNPGTALAQALAEFCAAPSHGSPPATWQSPRDIATQSAR